MKNFHFYILLVAKKHTTGHHLKIFDLMFDSSQLLKRNTKCACDLKGRSAKHIFKGTNIKKLKQNETVFFGFSLLEKKSSLLTNYHLMLILRLSVVWLCFYVHCSSVSFSKTTFSKTHEPLSNHLSINAFQTTNNDKTNTLDKCLQPIFRCKDWLHFCNRHKLLINFSQKQNQKMFSRYTRCF